MKIVRPLALAALIFTQGASAQITPTPPKPAATDAAKPDPAKDAFLGLPAADRKGAQEALIWLGLYNGMADGAFGKRTLDSISAYQKKSGAKADGLITKASLAEMEAAADKLRQAAGFASVDDAGSGIRISAPLKLLEKRTSEHGHTRYASKDGSVALDLYAPQGGDTLDALFHARIDETADRKVSYKAIKPDVFFVVSGEEGGAKFYSRYAQGDNGVLRGFEFRYAKTRADALDRVALAVANAFEPFPIGAAPKPTAPGETQTAVAPSPLPSAAPAPSGPILVATAFVVAPGQALTALAPAECAKPFVGGAPATFGRVDAASGLARLDGDFGAGAEQARFAAGGDDAFLLSRAPGAQPDKSQLEVSRSAWSSSGDVGTLLVPAARTARGAPVLSNQGELLGILAATKSAIRKIGGVILAEPKSAIAGDALKAFMAGGEGAAGEPMDAPEVARKFGSRALAVTCAS